MRSESQLNIQDARLVTEMTKPIGVEFKVKIVSVDKLTEITTRKVKGKMAPDFDTFIWGWGGDPYDPSLLLNLLTTKAIGASSDAFYSNPEYDRLYEQQSGEFDPAKRKEIVEQMIALSQRDLPYIVLTVDPVLQAYRTDKVCRRQAGVPGAQRRHHLRPGRLRARSPPWRPRARPPAAAAASDDGGSGLDDRADRARGAGRDRRRGRRPAKAASRREAVELER